MTGWGDKMLAAVHTVAHMAAIGFGLPPGAFTERMALGPHLLAPTGKVILSSRAQQMYCSSRDTVAQRVKHCN